jgi:hypothetical protein
LPARISTQHSGPMESSQTRSLTLTPPERSTPLKKLASSADALRYWAVGYRFTLSGFAPETPLTSRTPVAFFEKSCSLYAQRTLPWWNAMWIAHTYLAEVASEDGHVDDAEGITDDMSARTRAGLLATFCRDGISFDCYYI